MTTRDKPKRRWTRLLIDVRYQITFSLPMVLLAAALFVGLGHLAIERVDSATKIGLNQIEQTGTTYLADAEATKAALLKRARVARYGIVAGGVALCIGLFLFGLMLTHRVAGPLHRLEGELRKLAAGPLPPGAKSRKGDLLADVYEQFERACETIRRDERETAELLRQVVEAARGDTALKESQALAELRARLRAKEESLG